MCVISVMFSLWNSFTITIIWHRNSLQEKLLFHWQSLIWRGEFWLKWCPDVFQITLGSLISWLSLFCFFQAGIDSNRLVIALEPEAASILCKELQLAKYEDGSDSINVFSPGQRYLVLDAGGKNKTTLQKLNKIC